MWVSLTKHWKHSDGGTLREAVTHLQLLLELAAALLVAVELLFGGRGLVSDLLQLLKKLRRSSRLTTRKKKGQRFKCMRAVLDEGQQINARQLITMTVFTG